MAPRRWLGVMVIAGAALAALSFADAWIVHDRVISGEGYRDVITTVGPWNVRTVPVLSLGVAVALITALLAAIRLIGRGSWLPSWALVVGSLVALALVAATLAPVGQDGQASTIDLVPGWAAFVGVGLVALMAVAALVVERPRRGFVIIGGVLVVLLVGVGIGARWAYLQARAGSNQSWSEGSYTRHATDGLPAMTLTLEGGRYTLGDRWSGTWESSGWTVSLDDDPACPGSRGTYHAHGDPEPLDEDLRFVKVIDTCDDGARAEALETGIWQRNP